MLKILSNTLIKINICNDDKRYFMMHWFKWDDINVGKLLTISNFINYQGCLLLCLFIYFPNDCLRFQAIP